VLLDHPDLDLELAYGVIADSIEMLGGRFYTGPDVGTGDEELEILGHRTRFLMRPGPDGPGDLAQATAEGVVFGLQACLQQAFATGECRDRHFVIQGAGEVGGRLAKQLVQRGGRVSISDIDEEKLQALGAQVPVDIVSPGEVFDIECDVFCPCAMGGVMHDLSINRLRARIVAGSANTVLATPEHGNQLFKRGILYAPDYVINAGALIQGANFCLHGSCDNREAIARIGTEIAWILDESARVGKPTNVVADEEARKRVSRARGDLEQSSQPGSSNS
jgi:leucine dehydrogenase